MQSMQSMFPETLKCTEKSYEAINFQGATTIIIKYKNVYTVTMSTII